MENILAKKSESKNILDSKILQVNYGEQYSALQADMNIIFEQYLEYSLVALDLKDASDTFNQLRQQYLDTQDRYLANKVSLAQMKVNRLITQQNEIGNKMKYSNFLTWIIYKFLAYDSNLPINQLLSERGISIGSEITNWRSLIEHAFNRDGYICGRRLHFLLSLTNPDLVAGVDPWKITQFPEFIEKAYGLLEESSNLDTIINYFLSNADVNKLNQMWSNYEFSQEGKWVDYMLEVEDES